MTVPKVTFSQKAAKSVNFVEVKLRTAPVFPALIIFSAVVFFVATFLSFLAGAPDISNGLFLRGIANVSSEYPVKITPAGWAFSIWGVIYLLQFAWTIYSLGLLCRTTESGPAYLSPAILSPAFFIFFIFGSGFSTGWLFLWDRLMFYASFIFLASTALSLTMAVTIVSNRFNLYRTDLIDQGRSLEAKFIQVAVINGVGMYATWTTIATLINLAIVLVYRFSTPLADEEASVICLGILAFLSVVYIILDVTALEQYNRYLFTPYAVVMWALTGVLAENNDINDVSTMITAVLLGVVSLALLVKISMTLLRSRREQFQYQQMKRGNL